jgi:hypothetical protein
MNTAAGSYLRYLPAVYVNQPGPFLGHFLDIFQKLLTGLDDPLLSGRKGIQQLLAAEVIGSLFYPRFSFLFPGDSTPIPPISGLKRPQEEALLDLFNSYIGIPPAPPGAPDPQAPFVAWLDDFLAWLAAWVELVLDTGWTIDKKRTVIAQILALYRARGTAQGMSWLTDLWFDLPLTMTGTSADGSGNPVTGQLTVAIANPTPDGIMVESEASQPHAFVLRDRAGAKTPLVSGYAPWLFDVVVTLPNAGRPDFILTPGNVSQIAALIGQLRILLDRNRPAGSRYRISLLPGLPLGGVAAALGKNTLL